MDILALIMLGGAAGAGAGPRAVRKPWADLTVGRRAKLLQGCVTMAGPLKRGAEL